MMKNSSLLVALIFSVILARNLVAFAHNDSLLLNPKVAASIKVLDAWIEAKRKDREQPGLSIGIVYDQHLFWAKGYGMADVAGEVPATATTVYRLASISKLFTSTAIRNNMWTRRLS